MPPKREVFEALKEREEKLQQEHSEAEKKFVKARWVTEHSALANRDVRRREEHSRRVPKQLARMDIMQIEDSATGLVLEPGEVSDRISQQAIAAAVDEQTKQKRFDIILSKLGPYTIDYTYNGTHLALLGLRGHLATVRWQDFSLVGEVQLREKCTDVKFLVDQTMVAVAQRRFVYMYTKQGVEMHVLPSMADVNRLEYLPKHLLLVGTNNISSVMHYLDISTGQHIATKDPSVMRDPASCLRMNPATGVVATCDLRGVVKFWSPTVQDPLVQFKAHRGTILDISFHSNGRFFATLGSDHKMKIWDCRVLRALQEYPINYSFDTIDVSSNGMLAMGGGTSVQVWKDLFTKAKRRCPYMNHSLGYGNVVRKVKFCPLEDVLGVGHLNGFSSILIPGSGEPNPDFYYANPYETETHRKERVVSSLLDKLPPETISMDLQIGVVDEAKLAEYQKKLAAHRKAKNIRAKRPVRQSDSQGEHAPTGIVAQTSDAADEIDEELGVLERGATKIVKTKLEKLKEKKMARWDKKDSSDKIRSKQTMRHSQQVQRIRHKRTLDTLDEQANELQPQESKEDHAAERPKKRRKREEERTVQRKELIKKFGQNEAFKSLM